MNKSNLILKYSSIVLAVFSFIGLIMEVIGIFNSDMAAVTSTSPLGQILFMQAGNLAVQMLFSVVGLLAGLLGIKMSASVSAGVSLKYVGLALIVVYLVEGILLIGANPSAYSWGRIIFLLIVSGLYCYGAYQE